MSTFRNFVIGAVFGALTGATAALLLTPLSADELRVKIQAEIERIQQEVTTASAARRAELEAQLAALRQPRPPA